MKRKILSLACLLLTLALALCGCGDPVKEIEKEIEKLDKAYTAAAATYDGGEVTVGEAMSDFNYMYSMYYDYLSAYGFSIDADAISGLMRSAIETRVGMEIASARFDESHSLTEEELASLQADAQAQYDESYAQALSQAEGKNDAEKDANARLMLREIGMDYDNVYNSLLLGEKTVRMEDMLAAEITSISEEELLSAYEDRLSADEEGYTGGTKYFEMDMTEEENVICWNPSGFRAVKHILLIPDEAVLTAYADAVSALEEGEAALLALEEELADAKDDDSEEGPARSVEELQNLIAGAEATVAGLEGDVEAAEQACREDVKATSDEVYTRFAAGEDFDALMAEFGQDPGMKVAPTMERGYVVSAESVIWEPGFRDGAISIANVGELIAEPAVSRSGVHIIYYAAEITPGPVPLEQVRDALYAEVLESTARSHAIETIDAWVAGANPVYDVDAFAGALSGE